MCFAWCVCLLSAAAAAAGPLQDDLKQRRSRALEQLGAESVAIFWSAPTRVYSLDVDYEYRQDSNLLYLTGLDQPETILVLMPGNKTKREILFVRDADARREHWNGHSLTPAEASEQTGIETILTTTQFEPFVASVLSGQGGPTVSSDEGHAFFDALGQGRARLAMLLEPQRTLSDPPGTAREFGARMRDRFFGFSVKDASPVLASLRQIKTPYEQAVLRKSVAISADAHKAGMAPAGTPRIADVTVDGRVLLFATLLSLTTGLLFGLVPALHAARDRFTRDLRAGGRGQAGDGSHRARRALIVAEMALALVLLVGGGLLTRTFIALQRADLGFNPDHILTGGVLPPPAVYQSDAQRRAFYDSVLQRAAALPGVTQAALSSVLPLGGDSDSNFEIEGRPTSPNHKDVPVAWYRDVSANYFATMGIPLLRGRDFSSSDNSSSPPVAIINQMMADRKSVV